MRSLIYAISVIVVGTTAATAGDVPARPVVAPASIVDDPLGEEITAVKFLDQNWTAEERAQFYSTPQGSRLVPYDWFLALEQADSETPFRDRQNILKYRHLPQDPAAGNPDGLPVGFVADKGAGRRWLGMTCAACHTTDIRFGTTAYRIDGAPTQGDVPGFLSFLTESFRRTRDDPAKFARFATRILRNNRSAANEADLKDQLTALLKIREGYNRRNFAGYNPDQPTPPPTSYGRLDAVDAIVNELYHHALPVAARTDPTVNSKPANAPVSYPFLWDTPQHDLVEWLGIAKSGGPLGVLALSRNVGEVLGVFGSFVIPEEPSLFRVGYPSSVQVTNLRSLEDQLKGLWSPLWPADFPSVDKSQAQQGQTIYRDRCQLCHAMIDRKDANRRVEAVMNACGTDPQAFNNFFGRNGSSGLLEGANINFVPFTAKMPATATADQMISHVVAGVIIGQTQGEPPDGLANARFQAPQAMMTTAPGAQYKARPLNGIWATAPYLHNGSVPNLDALLRRAATRPTSFAIGTRTFDPVKVGYRTEAPGFPRFQVNTPDGAPIIGNANTGHEFGADLPDADRAALLEYLKTL